jgi:hypothetical protein
MLATRLPARYSPAQPVDSFPLSQGATMADAFADFLDQPNEQNFLRLRDMVIASPEYNFYAEDLDELASLIENGDYDEARGRLPELMPNWLLSPRAHQLIGLAAAQAGDQDTAQRENIMAQACFVGLTQSGNGSQLRPFRVTHIADEYDLLEALGKETRSQRLVTTGNGSFDVFTCADGSELWFDISPSVQTPA